VKVAVSSKGTDLAAVVDPRFGRAPYFVVVDLETGGYEGVENPGALAGTGAGVAAAQVIANAGAEAVITNSVGPHAYSALSSGGIEVYAGARGTVEAIVELFRSGELDLLAEPNADLKAGSARRGQEAQSTRGCEQEQE
jgi:predicted Fe-Mo cluster-binding NifX family protein